MKTILLSLSCFFCLLVQAYCQKPQEPNPPYSYQSEEVTFFNTADSIRLAGTLTLPEKGSNFTAVLLISGSGPQDRNSALSGHKPFLVLADYLTKNGIAVLRVDDRGTGNSNGNYNTSTLQDFRQDNEAAINYLRSRKEINQRKIGLVGHSLGGAIAPMMAAGDDNIGFIVLLAGPGIRGDQLMLLQKELIERKMGIPEEAITAAQKNFAGAYAIILEDSAYGDALATKLKTYFKKTFGVALTENQLNMMSDQLTVPWLVDLIRYNPAAFLSKVKCPVLALNGANDVQVPAKENLAGIKSGLTAGGNSNAVIQSLPGLNHLFQESATGMPQDYGTIEQTFSPDALEMIARWVQQQAR